MQRFLIIFFLSATVFMEAGYDNSKKSVDFRKSMGIKEKLRNLRLLTGKPCRVALAYLAQLEDFYPEPKQSRILNKGSREN